MSDGYRSASDWGFRRWIAESRAFTKPMPWWRFYPLAIRKWFWFDRKQRSDNAALGREPLS